MENKISINRSDLETVLNASKNNAELRLSYIASNEHYRGGIYRFLSTLEGLQGYIGIAGGGTQQFYLLKVLNSKNKLKEAFFIDINPKQLRHLSKIIEMYNESKDEKECYRKFAAYYVERGGQEHDLEFEGYYGFNDIGHPLEARMDIVDIKDYFSHAATGKKGKYFIYLSNVLDASWSSNSPMKVLNSIRANPNIEEGSRILIMHNDRGTVLKKEDGKLILEFADNR